MKLVEQGKSWLDKGKPERAEGYFQRAAQAAPLPLALNNWALCRYLAEDCAAALNILSPLWSDPSPNPFARALASLCHGALGQTQSAHEMLQAAISDFDRGLLMPALRFAPDWAEYTTIIKQAAGTLGEHQLVLDLHSRWPGRDLHEGAYAAGAAAFNLQRWDLAARYFGNITDPQRADTIAAFNRVIEGMKREVIPPFPLEYFPDTGQEGASGPTVQEMRRLVALGTVRMRFLGIMLDPDSPDAADLASGLVELSGDWGIELGKRLLAGDRIPLALKEAAAATLTGSGLYRPGEPIPIVHEGRATSIIIPAARVSTKYNPGLDRRVREAVRLWERDKPDEAYRLLTAIQAEGYNYPPAMGALAGLMQERGELDDAQALLESAIALSPDDPSVLFSLVQLWLKRGDPKRAGEYMDRIDRSGLGREVLTSLDRLEAALLEAELMAELPDMGTFADVYREEVEERHISPTLTLRMALQQIPVEWLNAAAAAHAIGPARRREQRAKLVAAALLDQAHMRPVLSGLEPDAREALRYLLAHGGTAKLQVLSRRFGSMEGDGFWWDEQSPTSAIGRLRLLGLVFVGRATVDGRRHKLAVVPVELRDLLAGWL